MARNTLITKHYRYDWNVRFLSVLQSYTFPLKPNYRLNKNV